ncbi:MAG: hypothetical protein V5A32_06035, partial [Halovenus sp.]
ALGGGGLGIVGALLPWVSVLGLSPGVGIEGSREIIVLLAGLVTLGLILGADWTKTTQLVTGVLGVVTTVVSVYTLAEVFDVIGNRGVASAEFGLYLSLVAGILILAGGFVGYNNQPATAGMYSHR